jgi:hypothetical protein
MEYLLNIWLGFAEFFAYTMLDFLIFYVYNRLYAVEINSESKPLKTKHNLFYVRTQGVPHSKHSPYRLPKTNHTMMYKVKLVYSEMYTKIITQCEHRVELLNVKSGGT